jgi:uncharacterized protein (TIGR00661 family)
VDQGPYSPKILLAPLDWGLGHATRCIPLIRELQRQNCRVVLAASGKGKALLQQEFPQLPLLDLPGYEIEYASTAWGLAVKIVAQIPKLLSAIKEEHAWLKKVVDENRFDAVIADNRYGLYHSRVKSVFITHQLCIKAPLKIAEDLLQETAYQYINRFTECWVPDAEGENNLAGELSHTTNNPQVALHYIGPLSRFQNKTADGSGEQLLVLLSGPEPQRTLLEERLLEDLSEYTQPVTLVRGLPGEAAPVAVAENITVYNHLPAAELEQQLRKASIVISRCGYSTVMDLAAVQKRSILIPTPGQTEQDYLAKYLMQKNLAFCVEQAKFRLKKVLELAGQFPYRPFELTDDGALQRTVTRFVSSLKTVTT